MDEAGPIPLTYERYHGLLTPQVKRCPVSPIENTYWEDVIIEAH